VTECIVHIDKFMIYIGGQLRFIHDCVNLKVKFEKLKVNLYFALQCTHAVFLKTTKNRNMSKPITIRNINNNRIEKFKIKAGIITTIGMNSAPMYSLLCDKYPFARFPKCVISPSLQFFLRLYSIQKCTGHPSFYNKHN